MDAKEVFQLAAIIELKKVAHGTEMTAEQIRLRVLEKFDAPKPSCWGPLIVAALGRGMIVRTDKYAHPVDSKSSARMNRVYMFVRSNRRDEDSAP